MGIIQNELGELYRTDDFEEPPHMKLAHHGPNDRAPRKPQQGPRDGARRCGYCGARLDERADPRKRYCCKACASLASYHRRKKAKLDGK